MTDPSPTDDRHWWETDVVLSDGGTVHLRPRRPEDAERIADLYERMSAASRYLRFAGATSAQQAGTIENAPEVDYDHHFSVVAELRGDVVGVAGYFRTPNDQADDEAEVAFAVDDREQGRGLGTLMLEYLVAAARERGIHRFVAFVLSDNQQMLRVFSAAGFDAHKRWGGGLVEVRFDIEPTPGSLSALRAREHSSEVRSVERLLCPQSIAVVGANREPGSIGHAVFRNLLDGDFVGPVYPVNPHAGAVAGVKAYPRVTDIPDPVDVAVIATPAATVLDVVDDCVTKGVEGLVVISAGFAEVGDVDNAAEHEHELVRRARASGMRVIGPNCMGVVNTDPAVRMNATFAASKPVPGRVAFASQSGGLGIALLGQGADRGLGISAFVSMGNKADVSSNDLIQYWEDDPNTDVILLYLESFGNPRKFARLARRISRTKPIVAVKSGRTPAGARGTASHTAALATPDVAVNALFRQAGVVRVETLAEMFDAATLLAHQPLPAGRRVAIVSNGGGPGILAADACVAVGLEVVELSAATQDALRAITPPGAGLRNPVDLVASAPASVYEGAIRIVLADDDVDAVVVLFVPPLVTEAADVATAIVAATEDAPNKPVLACFLVPEGRVDVRSADGRRRIPTFAFPEAAAVALERAARLAEWRARPEGAVPVLPGIDLDRARALVEHELADAPDGRWVDPVRIRQLLECFGITMASTVWVPDAAGAVQAADDVGYPIALKAGAADLVHKTDVGGVRLDLADADAVRAGFEAMHDALGDTMGGAIVQPMVTSGGVETIVGITRDLLFGSLVLFGMGGIQAELVRDTAVRFVPLTDVDAQDLVRSLRSSPLLFGYRNTPEVDVDSLEEMLLRVGLLAEHVPEVAEFDANPVIASPTGTVVLDAKLHLVRAPAEPPPELRRLRPLP